MKKVVLLKSRLSFNGGLEKTTIKLAQAFAKKGCEVTILTTGRSGNIDNVSVISLGKNSKFTLFHIWKFNRLCCKWLFRHQSDIIFGMERTSFQTHYRAGSGVHAAFLKRRFSFESFWKKFSLIVNPLHYYLLFMEKTVFENPHLKKLFVNSQMVKKEILQFYQVDPAIIEVVYNGVDFPPLKVTPSKPFHFLFIGNGYKRKGLHFLFPALSKLSQDFRLTVIGKEKDLSYFQKLASDAGIEDKVDFLGPLNHLEPYFEKSDVLLLPTIYDPCANVTLEALSRGLFVVTSSSNGASELITAKNGFIIKNLSDQEEVCETLLQTFKHKKTPKSSLEIRDTIKDLEFSKQLDMIVDKSLN